MRLSKALLLGIADTTASTAARADNDTVLRFDTPVQIDGDARFDRDSPLQPSASSFRIREANTLSSDSGERWALITVENSDGGKRILQDNYLVAEFANGERRHPSGLEGSFAAGEQQRKMVFFGYHRFPILRIFTAR
ncbi:MAG: hypothetical protein ACFE0K_06880 [Alcanivorax sp.]|uniref:hypothetical protein n=1 Tax=Alcanivorax sp. TaxID=1872427 RepID=UPI003DA6E5A8